VNRATILQSNLKTYRVPWILGTAIWLSMFLHPRDMWDGTIVSYASLTGNFQGIQRLTSDTNLHTVYYLFRGEFFLAELLHIRFIWVDRFVVGVTLLIICFCLTKFIEERCLLEQKWSSLSLVIFLTFPIWHILTSSTQTFYMVLTSMGMAGVFLFYKQNPRAIILGAVLIVLSFEMNSLIMFVPVLVAIFEITELKSKSFIGRLARPLTVFLIAIIYWVATRKFSVPTGLYVGYNKMINPFSIEGWKVIENGISTYSSFFILPAIALSILVLSLILFRTVRGGDSLVSDEISSSFVLIVPLILSSIIPYVLVDKSSGLDDFDWLGRHAILLSIPFTIGVTLLVHSISNSVKHVNLRKTLYCIALIALVLPQGLVLANGFATKYERQIIDAQLVSVLRKYDIPPGVVEIVGLPVLVPDHRVYESNFIFWEAFGSAKWWTRIAPVSDVAFSIPSWTNESSYQATYIFQPSESMCRTLITAELNRKTSFLQKIQVFLNLNAHITVQIKSVSSKC
jgi:hypothetical protein